MRRKCLITLIAVAIMGLLASTRVPGQSTHVELRDLRITIKIHNRPLAQVFSRLVYDYDIPIGFEQSVLDSEHEDYFFHTDVPFTASQRLPRGAPKTEMTGTGPVVESRLFTVDHVDDPLAKVLDDIVKQMKNYDWAINNEVVNIYPSRGRDPKLEKLLSLKVPEFTVPQGTAVRWTETWIMFRTPVIKNYLSDLDLETHIYKPLPEFTDLPLPEMNFSGLTFRDLLNAITRTKRGGWILKTFKRKEGDKEREFINLLI